MIYKKLKSNSKRLVSSVSDVPQKIKRERFLKTLEFFGYLNITYLKRINQPLNVFFSFFLFDVNNFYSHRRMLS
ncbi:hypothetical protein BH10ACI1_BH10ACI1_21120 [soil metagenome]